MEKKWLDFYKGKKVLITGHTGFKGTWMCEILLQAGARLVGYSLKPPTDENLFDFCRMDERMTSYLPGKPAEEMEGINPLKVGDVRNLTCLKAVFEREQPEIVIHMAAQPIVRESYKAPVTTYETNVMGTVNVLECIRMTKSVRSFINVTTDKVYKNREWEWGYRENEELNGYDPYSNSKSCSELVTDSYKNSFFGLDGRTGVSISTMRAGNVIGGGDFAADRIVPDCVRAAREGKEIIIRNPYSIRPFQHVLEPVMAYLMVAKAQYEEGKYAGSYNVGPNENDCCTAGELAAMFCENWNRMSAGKKILWINQYDGGPHEANFLRLDCAKLKQTFGWQPKWNVKTAVEKSVKMYAAMCDGTNAPDIMVRQIKEYLC